MRRVKEHRVEISFWTLLAVAVAVTTLNGYSIKQNRESLHELRQNKASIVQLQDEQIASCKNFSILKNAVNQFHSTILKFLTGAETARLKAAKAAKKKHDVESEAFNHQAASTYRELINATHTVKANCAQNK